MVVDVNAELNYGKSQLKNNRLVGLVRRFVNDCYRHTLQHGIGSWVGRIEDNDQEFDAFLSRHDLGLPGFVILKEPRDENDVIALFFELTARSVLQGYRILGLSQRDQYDGRGLSRRQADNTDRPMPADDRQLDVVEFKVTAATIIPEFERSVKNAHDIHLLVVWEEGQTDSNRFAFADIHHSKHYPDKIFDGVGRYLVDTVSGAEVQVLLLKKVVERAKGKKVDAS